jgi:hypothetical protein
VEPAAAEARAATAGGLRDLSLMRLTTAHLEP